MDNRYNRQIILPEIGPEGQEKLKSASVLIVGVGGLGSPISLYLTGAGVGTIGLIDDDVVSESNLQRQVLYSERQVGEKKIFHAQERLKSLNHEVNIRVYPEKLTSENAANIIKDYDIVVDGCDNFRTRYLINDTCVALGKPYVYGAICGFDGQVCVFNYHSGKTYRDLYPDEEGMLSMPHPPKGVMGVTPGITGSVEAAETIKLICGVGTPLDGRLWEIDLKTMDSHTILL